MLAEDYADDSLGANEFYDIIRTRMVSASTSDIFKLPLVYLVDSILNNAKGEFISVVGETITSVFFSVYSKIDDNSKKKFARLLSIWKKNRCVRHVHFHLPSPLPNPPNPNPNPTHPPLACSP